MKNNEFEIKNNILTHYNGDGGDVVIPNGVTKIGWGAFYDCSELTSVNIPNSVTEIDSYAFYECSNLTSVHIPDSVKEIGKSAFWGCIGLTSVNIPNSVEKIGKDAFYETKIKYKPQGQLAYKGFNVDMTCYRDFQYEEGKTYECDKAELCECGFHACLNPLDCFNYYYDDAVYHEVILEEQSSEKNIFDSKICGRKITIGRRLTLQEMAQIFNELNKNI